MAKTLLVSPNDDCRRITELALTAIGETVYTARDCLTAISAVQKAGAADPFKLILIDWNKNNKLLEHLGATGNTANVMIRAVRPQAVRDALRSINGQIPRNIQIVDRINRVKDMFPEAVPA